MTAQVSDSLFINGVEYSLAGVKGERLFFPNDVGLSPISPNTACWRGYICSYAVKDDILTLQNLVIWLIRQEVEDRNKTTSWPPVIYGVLPQSMDCGHGPICGLKYCDIGHKIDFSGGLLAASGFISELYVHMGFHPAWKYEKVYELLVEHGHVREISSLSQRMSELR